MTLSTSGFAAVSVANLVILLYIRSAWMEEDDDLDQNITKRKKKLRDNPVSVGRFQLKQE